MSIGVGTGGAGGGFSPPKFKIGGLSPPKFKLAPNLMHSASLQFACLYLKYIVVVDKYRLALVAFVIINMVLSVQFSNEQ